MKILQKNPLKSCCGTQTLTLALSAPIQNYHTKNFKEKGYFISEPYEKNGFLYLKKEGLIATGVFKQNVLTVKCQGANCLNLKESFFSDLESLV